MEFVISATFPESGNTYYLKRTGQFDDVLERAWRFEDPVEADKVLKQQQTLRTWSRLVHGIRRTVVPTYKLLCV